MNAHYLIQQIGEVFVAETAVVVGDVTMAAGVNIWHFCVVRGDVAPIKLGRNVNIQDGSVVHCNHGVELVLEDDVAVGHQALVHCKRVGAGSLIGSGARVLDDAVIGAGCIVAAGSLVPPKMQVPDGHIVMGSPAKIVRPTSDKDRAYIRLVIDSYQRLAREHVAGKYLPSP